MHFISDPLGSNGPTCLLHLYCLFKLWVFKGTLFLLVVEVQFTNSLRSELCTFLEPDTCVSFSSEQNNFDSKKMVSSDVNAINDNAYHEESSAD